eukprot:35017-Eustigmatos_ZCMA.PRE.1
MDPRSHVHRPALPTCGGGIHGVRSVQLTRRHIRHPTDPGHQGSATHDEKACCIMEAARVETTRSLS